MNKNDLNPYVAGREEWDDRMMSVVKTSHAWKVFSFCLVGAVVILAGGLAWVGGQSKIEPYLAVVDKTTYQVHVVGPAEKLKLNDQMMKGIVENEVRTLFDNLRKVIADSHAQKDVVTQVYSRIAGGSGAAKFVSEWYAERDPFKASETGTVSVQITAALPLSEQSWQVEWTETERSLTGEVQKVTRLKGVMTYVLSPPTDKAEASKNPIGFYVNQLSWSLEGSL